MKQDRIFFPGNPWPEGHVIDDFSWSAERRGADIWFHFHLDSVEYYAEREIEDPEGDEDLDSWRAPGVWGNYHRCILSSEEWHNGGFKACPASEFSAERIDGLVIRVDPAPQDMRASYESRAFHIYLLGHDSVADHTISFKRVEGSNTFDILWEGKVALTYQGDYELEHSFRAEIHNVELPEVTDGG